MVILRKSVAENGKKERGKKLVGVQEAYFRFDLVIL